LSDVERLTRLGGSGLDRLLQRLGKSLASVTLDAFAPGLEVEALKRQHLALLELRGSGALGQLFKDQKGDTAPSVVPIHGFPVGGVYDLEFHSTFPAAEWAHDKEYNSLVNNQTSYVRLWEHDTPQVDRRTIVAIHGWTMGDQRLNSLAFLPGLFYRLGLDVVLVELPFHGRRRGAREGVVFPSTDLALTNEALAQAIADLRSIRSIVERRSSTALGAIGMSLGAYVASLWAGLDKLAFCIPVVPLVSMSDLAWRLVGEKPHLGAEAAGVTKEVLQEVFAHHCPLSFTPQTAGESAFIIASRDDSVVPATQPERLGAHWEGARLVWVDGGHEALFQRSQAFSRAIEFLSALGLIKHTNFADLHPVA